MSRILVADDDGLQLDLRKLVFEAAGHEVTVALHPRDALRHIQQGIADLVVMDLRFPNAEGAADSAEGLALIRRIRDGGSRVPVIVLSGWPDDLYGQPEEQMVSRILVKPVNSTVLMEAVAALTP